ncbi:MAG: nicotinate-nucleotide adenylyltransferase [Lachnospiraceae bacterium]|nr:nicotinate-nucleotide adenylyltransferase [Lachnospiraceae bacterium]MBR2275610.1 nicotinate-nucleotide adenylyltransferase [Lachnospiraceae bacterium]
MGRRIGIFGGTFDPPHLGHLGLARDAYEKVGLEEVIFVPTGTPKYKLNMHGVSEKEDRLQMLELLIKNQKWASVSTIELYRQGPSYTSDTVTELKEQYPEDELFLIVGSDSLKNMAEWHKPEVVFKTVGVVALLRGEDTWDSLQPLIEEYKKTYGARVGVVISRKYNVSSTDLRNRISAGQDVSEFVPEDVAWYISARGLYTGKLLGADSRPVASKFSEEAIRAELGETKAADTAASGGSERAEEPPERTPEIHYSPVNKYLEGYLSSHFDGRRLASGLVNWIKDWFAKNGPGCIAVVGLSGGKDSTMVATLCRIALGPERVFGVLMPDHEQSDLEVAKAVAMWLGISYSIVNIGQATDGLRSSIAEAELFTAKEGLEIETETTVAPVNGRLVTRNSVRETKQMLINIPPRIRMTTLYAISQAIGGRVSNNCNRSENYVGYSTLYGDAAGDFSPLHNLTVTEIIRLGEFLDIPSEFIHKSPSDGLTGKTDEDVLGFSYETLDTYILTGICEDEETRKKIDQKHQANLFKLQPMAQYKP